MLGLWAMFCLDFGCNFKVAFYNKLTSKVNTHKEEENDGQ